MMSGGNRRALRVPAPSDDLRELRSVDAVTDPQLLAHAVIALEPRREDHQYPPRLRCSGLHQVCVREQLIGFRENLTRRTYNDTGLQVTFDIGNAIHFYLQNSPRYFRDTALGWWECAACGYRYFGRRRKKRCPECRAHARAFFYQEHFMKLDAPYPLSGHPDLLLEVHPGDVRVTEIKTINGEDFDGLQRPLSDHVMQVHGYLLGLPHDHRLPMRVHAKRALILYVSKGMKARSLPMKAFHVTRQPHVVRAIEADLHQFQRGLEDGDYLPDTRQECVAADWKRGRARRCAASELCNQLHNDRVGGVERE